LAAGVQEEVLTLFTIAGDYWQRGKGMMRKMRLVVLFVSVVFLTNVWPQAPKGPAGAGWPMPASANIPINTPMGTGPHPAIMEQDPSLPTHTEYRPVNLAALGAEKLPVVAWGNGGCYSDGSGFRDFLTEIASYGFLVIAPGPIHPPDWMPQGMAQTGQAPAGQQTQALQMIEAIDWAIAENGRAASKYFGKIDTGRIAVMGQSCGGIQAITVSSDPRVTLTVAWNSGLMAQRSANAPWPEATTKDALNKLHAPIFYFTGDKTNDIAFSNGLDDFQRIEGVPALHAYKDGMSHGGTYRQANGGELGKVAVALLEWQMKGNRESGKMFVGHDCGLCRDPQWHVSKKRIE
jgi:dienelactone hydrolase